MAKERLVLKQLLFDQEQAMIAAAEQGPLRGPPHQQQYINSGGAPLQMPSCFDVKVTPEHVR